MTANIPAILDNAKTILASMREQRERVAARHVCFGNYVLRWFYEGSSLYVVRCKNDQPSIGGFARSLHFGDRAAALAYLRRTGIANGRGEQPVPVLASMAKQGALHDLDGVIKTLTVVAGEEA